MAIYMKYGSIEGDVTTKGVEKWIELNSFQWGVGRGIGTAARGLANRESSEPSISEITVTKAMDGSSTKLLMDALAGELNNAVTLKFTTTTKDKTETYLTIELENVGLSGHSLSSGGDKPTESLSLNFTKVVVTYSKMGADTQGKPDRIGYDLTQMAKA